MTTYISYGPYDQEGLIRDMARDRGVFVTNDDVQRLKYAMIKMIGYECAKWLIHELEELKNGGN